MFKQFVLVSLAIINFASFIQLLLTDEFLSETFTRPWLSRIGAIWRIAALSGAMYYLW